MKRKNNETAVEEVVTETVETPEVESEEVTEVETTETVETPEVESEEVTEVETEEDTEEPEIKALEDCTLEELIEVACRENTEVPEEATKEELIKLINENRKLINEVKNTKVGIVKAGKLNVRKEADREGDVLTIISKGTSVEVFLDESTEEFYCVEVLVNNEFAKGYCVKEFITIK